MTHTDAADALPDPDFHPEFYADTTIKRFVAWLVDTVLITLITLLAIPLTAFIGLFFLAGLYLLVGLVYRTVSLTRWSATPGMRLMAVELRQLNGARFDLGMALLHTGAYMVMMTIFVLQAISIILMMTGSRGQGLHDHLLGTAALNQAAVRR
ncbi:hypothetical protein DKT77_00125 [Meridianimarinicoccus roseus]|jgi:uncharacterized RDD family membrane protein YckC|uniref:RDD domain-containing protein n=1 Tax=Meridianimarinicoccus roseus TaxID=2072018 RepID=A0A2V2LKJ1_9RHOB|nr:RDD family protein [Meridianimarinicoccus roseus]PWR04651.1 hypothetical protein DKT77_00125 [Meridianimarinicoccus roseus]